MSNEIHRYRRFKGWDYSRGASLFITIVVEPRRPILGEIKDGVVSLSPLGEKVAEALNVIPRLNPAIKLFGRVVMPDHIHFNCSIEAGIGEPLKVLGNAIRRFKNYTTKEFKLAEHSSAIRSEYGSLDAQTVLEQPKRLWQQGYHDYLLVSREMIDSTERYIAYNPLKWALMHGVGDALHISEPLVSPRLDPADWWKGVGNINLLAPQERLVSLRVSRKVTTDRQITQLLSRMQSAIEKNYIIISGFISPGEKAVRDMLCQNARARFIRMLPSSIPNASYKPESRYVAPFNDGRYLEIAKGNNDADFSRSVCLNLNEEIIEIASATNGLAIYWKENGAEILRRNIN